MDDSVQVRLPLLVELHPFHRSNCAFPELAGAVKVTELPEIRLKEYWVVPLVPFTLPLIGTELAPLEATLIV